MKISRGNQKPYVEERQTRQWPVENVQTTNNSRQNARQKLSIKKHEFDLKKKNWCELRWTRKVGTLYYIMLTEMGVYLFEY